MIETLHHDVLIVGGGAAGIRAAIAAAEKSPKARIAVVSKVYPMRSHTVSAEGGTAAVMRDYDSFDSHAYDTIKGSDFLADQDVVEEFVREAPGEVIRLEHWGCPWSRDPDGKVSSRAFGGMTVKRTVFATDKVGFHMLHTLYQTSLKFPNVRYLNEWFVTSLLVDDGRCIGVSAIELATGEMRALTAGATILTTGGAGRVWAFTTNGFIKTGDGMSMAYRAGVPLKDMEFVQYHPTGLPGTGILITEAVRGEGAYMKNKDGERFLKRYVPNKMELGPRDILSRAMIQEFEAGRGFKGPYGDYMVLDLTHIGEEAINKKLPFARELAMNYIGIDPVKDPIPVRPVVHYIMGGVSTDKHTRTPMKGLLSAGEAACISMNGANRLGSNSLSECVVFGARAGASAVEDAASAPPPSPAKAASLTSDEWARIQKRFLGTGGTEKLAMIRTDMQALMEKNVGVYRSGDGLSEAAAAIPGLRERATRINVMDRNKVFNLELTGCLELEFMLDVAETVCQAAVARKESRGSHTRRDFPTRDDANFLKHSLCYRPDGGGPPRVDYVPATITRWQPEERKY